MRRGAAPAIHDEAGARAGRTNVGDQLLVAGAIKHRNANVADVDVLRACERANVLADGALDVDDADALGAAHELVHVEDRRRVVHAAAVSHRDHRERARAPLSGEPGAVDGIHRNIALSTLAVANLLAVVEPRGVVFLALADHDGAVHVHR